MLSNLSLRASKLGLVFLCLYFTYGLKAGGVNFKADLNYTSIESESPIPNRMADRSFIGPLDINITERCACRNNATSLTNGQFNETIVVSSGPGESWEVLLNTGFFEFDPDFSVISTTEIAVGTALTEQVVDAVTSDYVLRGVHTDAAGYSIRVTNGVMTYNQINTCFYPNPVILNLPDYVCTATPAFDLEGMADQTGSGSFTIDAAAATRFDPAALGAGTVEVEYTFDADDNQRIDRPGCIQSVTQEVEIDDDPSVACITNINVSLGADCMVEITSNMVLASDECRSSGAYEIELMTLDSTPVVDNIVTKIGTYIAEVTNLSNGISCWGYVHVEDKMAPTIDCPANIELDCQSSLDPAVTGMPVASDNCYERIYYEDEFFLDRTCGTGTIERTWFITDSVQKDSCVQIITLVSSGNISVIWPADFEGSCEDYTVDQVHPDSLRRRNSRPRFSGECRNLAENFTDEYYDLCDPSSFKILRYWVIRDWCDPDFEELHTQTIKIIDTVKPELVCPADLTLSTDHDECSVRLPNRNASATDNCDVDPDITRQVFNSSGVELTGNRVPPGMYTLLYTAEDACGNIDTCSHKLTVEDKEAPTAICDKNTNITLTSTGRAEICFTSIDDLSNDNCQLDRLLLKKDGEDDSRFRECVEFRCRDEGINIVHLRAYDIYGNFNDCWANVFVEDKTPPRITCPPDVTVDCRIDVNDPENTGGEATVQGGCQNLRPEFTDINDNNSCATRTITRTWRVEKTFPGIDGIPGTADDIVMDDECEQIIEVVDTTGVTIEWPSDLTIPCTDNAINLSPTDLVRYNTADDFYDNPKLSGQDCEHLGISMVDQIFDLCGTESYKLRRVWNIVDWCSDLDTTHVQVIWIRDAMAPTLDITNQVVDITTNDTDCRAYVDYQVSAFDECTQVYVSNDSPFSFGRGSDLSGYYPKGTTVVNIRATDACGNSTTEELRITVRDTKNPTAVCGSGYSINLKSTGLVSICAEVFDRGSSDNCTFTENLKFYIQKVDQDGNLSGQVEECLTYTCAEFNEASNHQVQFIVEDADGNRASCFSILQLQDNDGYCGTSGSVTATIQGQVSTTSGLMVEDLSIYLNQQMQQDHVYGNFMLDSLPTGQNYDVEIQRSGSIDEGVNTLDLILMRRHILRLQTIDGPYRRLAADVNQDGSVSTLDMIEVRQSILRLRDVFSSNENWMFLPQSFQFSDPDNPWDETYPRVSTVMLDSDKTNIDFVSIKLGDIDESATSSTVRSQGELELLANFETDRIGLSVEQDLTSGMQFSLVFDKEVFDNIRVLEGLDNSEFSLTEDHTNYYLNVVWVNEGQGFNPSFGFVKKAYEMTDVTEYISLSKGAKDNLSISRDLELQAIKLTLNEKELDSHFEVYQNRPNPFNHSTEIRFDSSGEGSTAIEIIDVAGKVIFKDSISTNKGLNTYKIYSSDLNQKGVLFYRLTNSGYSITKRMVLRS